MALEEPKDSDVKVESSGFNFVVEEDLTDVYGQFTVDYSDSWLRRGFVIFPAGGSPGGSC